MERWRSGDGGGVEDYFLHYRRLFVEKVPEG